MDGTGVQMEVQGEFQILFARGPPLEKCIIEHFGAESRSTSRTVEPMVIPALV